jgi:hypothetical protein
VKSLLEIHNRSLRAVGAPAIVAAVAIHAIRWVAILLLVKLGGPWLP